MAALGGALGALGLGSALDGAGSAVGGFFMGIGQAASGLFQGLGEAAKAPDGAIKVKTKRRDVEFNPVSLSMAAVGGVAAYGLYRAVDRWIVPSGGGRLTIPPLLPPLPSPLSQEGVDLAQRVGLSPTGTATPSRNTYTPGRDVLKNQYDAQQRLLARQGETRDKRKGSFDPVSSAEKPFRLNNSLYVPGSFKPAEVIVDGRTLDRFEIADRIASGPGNVDTNLALLDYGGISRARLRREGILG